MQLRYLGKTGLRVSTLALGTMSFGSEADVAESARIYQRCRDAGINHVDTADVYGKGASEKILGDLIRSHRDEVVLATKGSFPTAAHANACGGSRRYLMQACEASLRRLGTDRIDLYYVHRFDPRTALEETLSALSLLTQQGKICYVGLSNFAAYQCQRLIDLSERTGQVRVAAIQPMYNVLKRQAEVELFPMARDNELGVFPYSPLAAGILTGKYAGTAGPEARLQHNKAYQARYAKTDLAQIGLAMQQIAKRIGVEATTLAIAYAASHPDVTAPLLGARNSDQLTPALAAANLTLDADTRAEIDALTSGPARATDRDDDGSAADMWQR
jgi:aryl-alcohol dehydrogenase-like predicted oxidoreductase